MEPVTLENKGKEGVFTILVSILRHILMPSLFNALS